jgi:hypothetical protein
MTGNRAQGWYPDPGGVPNRWRWWDGAAWSADFRDGPESGADEPPVDDVFPAAARLPEAEPADARIPAAVTPVVFEAVEPDRTRRRVLTGIAGVALSAVSVAGGYFWGSQGKDGAKAAEPPTGPAPDAGSVPQGDPATPAASAAQTSEAPSAPPAAAVTQGLVGRWRLDAASAGEAADSAGKHPATVFGTVTWAAERGGSAVFAGAGSIATAQPVLDTTRSFTIAAWAKLADTGAFATVVTQDGSQVSGFYLHFNKDAKTWAFVRTSEDAPKPASWFTVPALSPPRVGVWTHLAGTYDASTARMALYVDGSAQGDLAYAAPWKAQGPLAIGRAASNVDRFRGSIAEVQAFDRALSPAEIRRLAAPPQS